MTVIVEKSLPLKREYILYAQLSKMQIDLYNAIIGRNLQGFLTSKRLAEIQNGDCEIELTEGISLGTLPYTVHRNAY